MATDSEWERIGEAAAAAGMEKSRYVIHRALAPESLPPEVTRKAVRQSLVLAVLEERALRAAGAGDEWDAAGAAVDAWLEREGTLSRLTERHREDLSNDAHARAARGPAPVALLEPQVR